MCRNGYSVGVSPIQVPGIVHLAGQLVDQLLTQHYDCICYTSKKHANSVPVGGTDTLVDAVLIRANFVV